MAEEMYNFDDEFEEDLGLDVVEVDENEEAVIEQKEENDMFSEVLDKVDTNDVVIKEDDLSIISDLLLAKGIKDSTVKVIGEDEKEEDVNFYDLSREEQLMILSPEESPEDLGEMPEKEFMDYLKENNLSVQDYLNQYKESVLSEFSGEQEITYDIDAYDDQELYLLDLKNKFDLTDEELQSELEKELTNEDLFKKKTEKLRVEYKGLEDQFKADQIAEKEATQLEEYNQFSTSMGEIATNVSDFHGIMLEDSEKQETLSYLLDLDDSGVSKFATDINDPNKLYEAAWYLRYGKEAFEALESAYEAEIKKLTKTDKPRAVVRNAKK